MKNYTPPNRFKAATTVRGLRNSSIRLCTQIDFDICSFLVIEKLNTTAYHPRYDGLTERFKLLRKQAVKFGRQWDLHILAVLWAYRNVPHTSTGEKPSYLLFGFYLRSPTDAALYPESSADPVDVSDYKVVTSLSQAQELATSVMKKAQKRYKKYYHRYCKSFKYKADDWILIRFPATGKQRKLSKPWYGAYRIVYMTETGVTAVKVHRPGDGTIAIHASRVAKCPPEFPAGSYWYGGKRSGPGRPSCWVDELIDQSSNNAQDTSADED